MTGVQTCALPILNREILRLRPDVNCVIHLHHDEMIAFMAAGYETIRSFSLTYGYLMQKPAHYLPASVNVEEDVGPIQSFIQDTNCIIMKRHGFTVLGRSVSEAYHRTCVLVSEIKRNIIVEQLCAANGRTPEYISDEELAYMAMAAPTMIPSTIPTMPPTTAPTKAPAWVEQTALL